MEFSHPDLPSERKFGFFFSAIFCMVFVYLYMTAALVSAVVALFISLLLMTIAVLKPDILLPFNVLWSRFGILLGMIVSPFVLALIFFTMFTSISMITRMTGRDELRMLFKKQDTYWIKRNSQSHIHSFKDQY